VTLSAEGQFLRAHRVILSACSPYFRNLFKSNFLNDKHPVVFMKDMEFENLKSLVEYMYKGEANVPQQMLTAFIKDAESLQIRGLAEGANKMIETEGILNRPPVQHSTPINKKSKHSNANQGSAHANRGGGSGGILAAHLAKMNHDPTNVPMGMFDLTPESLHASIMRNPGLMAGLTAPPFPPPHPMKKSRKSSEPRPRGGSPNKDHHVSGKKPKLTSKPLPPTNNNYDDEDGSLKIDEDADPEKENLNNKMEADDIAEVDHSNGVSEEEEEPSMPGPGGELADAASEIINPWTGSKLQLSEENDDNSAQEDTGLVGWPNMLGDLTAPPNLATPSLSATPNAQRLTERSDGSGAQRNSVPRLKRLNNASNHNVYTQYQTAEGQVRFRCTECSRSFNLKCTLLRHVRHQHQGRFVPHPCRICGQVFKRTDHLKVHMKKIHRITSATRPNRNAPENPTNVTAPPAVAGLVADGILPLPTGIPTDPQPLALTKNSVPPDRLSKDSETSQN